MEKTEAQRKVTCSASKQHICWRKGKKGERVKEQEKKGGRKEHLKKGLRSLREFLLKIICFNKNMPGTRIHFNSSLPPGGESCEGL